MAVPDFISDADVSKHEVSAPPDFIPDDAMPTDTPTGGTLARFVSGLRRNLVPSWDSVKAVGEAAIDPTMVKPAKLWLGMGRAALSDMAAERAKGSVDPNLLSAAGHIAAGAIPIVGPAAAHAGEAFASGNTAGGGGETIGLLAPFAEPLKALGLGRRTAAALENSAANNTLKAVAADTPTAQRLLESGQMRNVQDTLGVGTRPTLAARAEEARVAAQDRLEGIKAAHGDKLIDAAPAAQNLRDLAPGSEITVPSKPMPTPDELRAMTPDQLRAFLSDAKANTAGSAGAAPEVLTSTGDRALTRAVASQAKVIEDLAAAFPEGVPARELFARKAEFGHAAARGGAYSKLAGVPISAAADAQKAAQGVLAQTLETAIPGLADANIQSSTWIKASDALKKAVLEERLGGAPAAEVFSAKALLASGTKHVVGPALGMAAGVGMGLGSGGVALAGIGGYGGWRIVSSLINSPLWHTLSAEGKLLLADSLANGLGRAATSASRATALGVRAGALDTTEPITSH